MQIIRIANIKPYPYDESMKLLATTGDNEPIDSRHKEDSDVINAP
jgi:hypothetical protein